MDSAWLAGTLLTDDGRQEVDEENIRDAPERLAGRREKSTRVK